ncbi:MAG TPA: sulfotransferase [Mycobacteriales bacterium]|nr:sulfotransferase [Mycobacteriales bacterium]
MSATSPRLPDFFVIGAQKAGTSTLHRLLRQHPEVYMCDPKEPDFFAADQEWARGAEWYAALFAAAGDAVAVGEASTTYAMYPHYGEVVHRLTAAVAEPRLVYILREPLARMRSAYRHGLAGGTETRPIGEALTADPRYLLTSSYALQLERWLRRVPRERILLLSLEQLRDTPEAVMSRLFGFLGIDRAWRPGQLPAANISEGKLAPRGWWRALGSAAIRHDKTDWVPAWAARLNDSASPMVRRELSAQEFELPSPVMASLQRALAADLDRLRRHWGSDPAPDWLQEDPKASAIPSTSP